MYKDGINKDVDISIIYLKEAIQKNDKLAMFNLAKIYLYEISSINSIQDAIELLLPLSKINFPMSRNLICLALIKNIKMKDKTSIINFKIIQNELYSLIKSSKKIKELVLFNEKILADSIYYLIKNNNYDNAIIFELHFNYYKNIDLIYNYNLAMIQVDSSNNQRISESQQNKMQEINNAFYDGFEN